VSVRRPTLASRDAEPATRPTRGSPDETRRRLVAAAGVVFNRDGFEGTDTNRIAREAGYAPGTFYKHFTDKQAIFGAVYDEWVGAEWRTIDALLERGGPGLARALAEHVVEHHRRWRVFLRSLRALSPHDPAVRRAHRAGRRRQLDRMTGVRARNLFVLYAIERVADALADDEPEALGVDAADLVRGIERAIAGVLP
jgi:AcrR family transcriptional regulator